MTRFIEIAVATLLSFVIGYHAHAWLQPRFMDAPVFIEDTDK